jgi:tetratricopeptide (TPR) repeat protein
MRLDSNVLLARLSPDGARIITAEPAGAAMIWDSRTAEALTPRLRHQAVARSARFSADGSLLATGSADCNARVWDSRTGAPLDPPLLHGGVVYDAEFSPDGRLLVTACADKAARLWDHKTGRLVAPPLQHPSEVVSAQFGSDGRSILTVAKDNTARLWEAPSGQGRGAAMRHDGLISSARLSRDGFFVLTASADRTARVWDSRTGAPVCEPIQHESPVNAADFSPDALRVATACEDGTMRVWHARLAQPLSKRFNLGLHLYDVEFSPDGRWVLAGGTGRPAVLEIIPASSPIPEWLAGFTEAVIGQRLNAQRSIEHVPPTQLLRCQDSIKRMQDDASHRDSCQQWVAWFLADRSTRPLSPSARSTISDWIGRVDNASHSRPDPRVLRDLREAVEHQPTNGRLAADLARLLVTVDSSTDAKPLIEADWQSRRALALAPSQAESWWARALCLERMDDLSGALQAIEHATQLEPDNIHVGLATAALLEKAGRVEDALETFGQVCETAQRSSWPGVDVVGLVRFRRCLFLQRQGRADEARPDLLRAMGVSPRDPQTPPWLLDLSPFLNSGLTIAWANDPVSRKDLIGMSVGRQTLGGVEWDIRGLLQLSSPRLRALHPEYPDKIEGVPVRQSCRRLHFLHAADLAAADGTRLGGYIVHYADGGQQEIPIVYGQDMVAWDLDPPRTNSPPVVAWRGRNRVNVCVQLFKTTWDNPRPNLEVTSLDVVSAMAPAAPFIVAITVQE